MVFSLTIVTLNVKGLADPERRRWFFYILRTLSAHVICLQEVYADPAQASFWTQEWEVRLLGTNTRPFSFLPPLVVLRSTTASTVASYLRHSVTKVEPFPSPTSMLLPLALLVLNFLTSCLNNPFITPLFDFLVGDWNAYPDPTQDRSSTSPLILITHGHIFDHVFSPFLMPHSLELRNTFSLSTTRVSICMLVLTMFLLIPTILTSMWTLE